MAEYFEQQTGCNRYRRKISKSRGAVFRGEESVIFTFPYQTNGNHAMELSTVGHVILRTSQKGTFDFPEIVNNYGLKRKTVCQIVRFIIQFYPIIQYIQIRKYFHNTILGNVGRGCCKKIGVLGLLSKIFG